MILLMLMKVAATLATMMRLRRKVVLMVVIVMMMFVSLAFQKVNFNRERLRSCPSAVAGPVGCARMYLAIEELCQVRPAGVLGVQEEEWRMTNGMV